MSTIETTSQRKAREKRNNIQKARKQRKKLKAYYADSKLSPMEQAVRVAWDLAYNIKL